MDENIQDVVKTSLKTVVAFALVAVFSLIIAFNANPAFAVEFYSDLGFESRVYHYQTLLAERGSLKHKYASANLAIKLDRPSSEIERRTADFLLSADEATLTRLDESKLNTSPSRAMDVLLYSEENYFALQHFACNQSVLWNGSAFVSIDGWELADNAKDCAIIANQLARLDEDKLDKQKCNQLITHAVSFTFSSLEELFVLRATCALAEKSDYPSKTQLQDRYETAFEAYVQA